MSTGHEQWESSKLKFDHHHSTQTHWVYGEVQSATKLNPQLKQVCHLTQAITRNNWDYLLVARNSRSIKPNK